MHNNFFNIGKNMSLKIYRIDTSFFGKINNRMKKPDLSVMAKASLFGGMIKNYKDYKRDKSFILSNKDEIDRFTEAFGNDWVEDHYYIRYPKSIRKNYLIPESLFHKYIMREQISDIISYVRANFRVK